MREALRRLEPLLQLKIVLPVLLAAGLLGFAFSLGDLQAAFDRIRSMRLTAIAAGFVLAFVYWLLKEIEFRTLLGGVGLRPDWRRLTVAFAVGEVCITVPAGIYAQNYVLRRIQGADLVRSAAATTGTLATEGAVLMVTLVVLSIPGWPWLQPTILGLMALFALVFGIGVSTVRRRQAMQRLRGRRLRPFGSVVFRFLRAMRALAQPRLLTVATALTACYLAALVAAFLIIGRSVGNPDFTLVQATTIYFFSLGVSMIVGGVVSQLGVVESVGMGAAHAWGFSPTEALAMMLGFRLVWMGSIWLISGIAMWVLRRELRRSPEDHLEETVHRMQRRT